MDTKKEIAKLINVLRRTARMAQQAAWIGNDEEGADFCRAQYNKVLERLTGLDETVASVFEPLDDTVSLSVIAMACRQLAAYFEDDVKGSNRWGHIYGAAFDTDAFKSFWKKSAQDIEDLGEFIRENLESWAKQRNEPADASSAASEAEEGGSEKAKAN